jgi:VWFA-related protein
MSTRRAGQAFLLSCFLVSGFSQPTGNRSITLDVAVTDKAGKPVPGLQRSDFTLLDNKQPQKILSFRAIDGAAPGPPVEVVLLVDQINTPFIGVARVRDQIVKFLGENGGKLARPVSVVMLTDSGTTVRTAPSQDGNALIADLNQADFGLRTIRKDVQMYAAADQQRLSDQALDQLATYETPKPGRKLVVWISPGWPLFLGSSGNMTTNDLKQVFGSVVALTDALQRARITLYNIDPIGAAEGEVQMSDFEQFFKGVKKFDQAQLGDLGLQAFAYRSGGRILNASNDIASEIATCVADGIAFYEIGFNSLPGDGPNEYHELDLKVGKPKLTVRAPSGYYAQP